MSTLQELKIDRGISTQREVRQGKKDLKRTYAPLLEMKTKLSKVLEERERSKNQKAEEEKLRAKFEQEEKFRREIQQQEKEVFYMPHKPVVRESATSTKVRMVFDASARPHLLANSVNECMHTGPPLQPLLWDIMIRARMSSDILLADLQKAFLQIAIKE